MAAVGFNFRLMFRWLSLLLRLIPAEFSQIRLEKATEPLWAIMGAMFRIDRQKRRSPDETQLRTLRFDFFTDDYLACFGK